MKKKLLILPLVFVVFAEANAQDIHFSQITATPLLLNPSQAGLGHDVLAIINYKDQWRSVATASAYRTFNTSADFSLLKKPSGTHLGMGVNIFSDKAGDANMGTTTGQLHLSGVLGVNDNNLVSAGIFGGYGQRSLQYDKLYWDNQYDGVQYNSALPSGEPQTFANYGYLDIGAGMSWFFSAGHSTLSSNDAKLFNLGVAFHHLNKPVYSYYGNSDERLPMKIILHGNADIGIKNYNLVLQPSYIVMLQHAHREITPGLVFKYITKESSKYTGRKKASAFMLGGYFRMKDAIVATAGYEFSSWAIGMSYDINISDLSTATNARGGFEISLRYILPNPFGGKATSTSKFN
ncbi:MAG: hypothetical protein FD123_1284 [Bacteroidetes bacterium]|nr:MAG: hypothetical protein FD123_1284 [Bacteroidota bacterium]